MIVHIENLKKSIRKNKLLDIINEVRRVSEYKVNIKK